MILFKKAADLHKWLDDQRQNGATIGFVPTMGALHPGHLSLVAEAGKSHSLTVCSIFVNPTQFNDPKDFEKYPVTIERDIDLLEEAGTGVVFLPTINEIYPSGLHPARHYELGSIETLLEGAFRPGHYQGVCQVVHRLLDIVHPDELYLGQKDYQQCMVLTKLIELLHWDSGIKVTVCPTLREHDGLAMSSRNVRLSMEERKKAAHIYQSLNYIREHIITGSVDHLVKRARTSLEENDFSVDYVAIADAKTLEPVDNWDGNQKLVALAAAYLGSVRLIDNLVL